MEGKNNKSITYILLTIIILLEISCVYLTSKVINYKINKDNNLPNNVQETNNNNNNIETIPVEDLYAVSYDTLEINLNNRKTDMYNAVVYKISNNDLYYYDLENKNYVKMDSDVKRIKTARLGAQHAGTYFLVIKNDGTVKLINNDVNNSYEIFEPFKDYKVDDITNIERKDNYIFKANIKLTDGSTQEVEFKAL